MTNAGNGNVRNWAEKRESWLDGVAAAGISKPPPSASRPPHLKRQVYVKSALAGSNSFYRTYSGLFEPSPSSNSTG